MIPTHLECSVVQGRVAVEGGVVHLCPVLQQHTHHPLVTLVTRALEAHTHPTDTHRGRHRNRQTDTQRLRQSSKHPLRLGQFLPITHWVGSNSLSFIRSLVKFACCVQDSSLLL